MKKHDKTKFEQMNKANKIKLQYTSKKNRTEQKKEKRSKLLVKNCTVALITFASFRRHLQIRKSRSNLLSSSPENRVN